MEAEDAKLQVEEQRVLSQKAGQEAQVAQSGIAAMQQKLADAEASLAAATAAWEAERAALEAAGATAAELTSAEEIERRTQAAIAGELSLCWSICMLSWLHVSYKHTNLCVGCTQLGLNTFTICNLPAAARLL